MARVPHHNKPALRVILYFLLFVIVIAMSCEFITPTPWVEKVFPYRSVGNYDYQFEIKWFRLQDYVKQNGGVDVIVLGSSLVNTGIDPDVMAETYFEQTGVKLRIFNFGVEGLTVAPNSVTAAILMERYHPALLVYVTEMREFMAGSGLKYETPFLAGSWLRYERGDFNINGWLIAHSAGLQHYLPYRNWMRADFLNTQPTFVNRSRDTTASGYEHDNKIGQNIDAIPDPNNPDDAENFAAYQNFQTDPRRLNNLKSILDLRQNGGTTILVVEMPVHPTFYVFVGGEAVHKQFQQTLSSFVKANDGLFLPAETCNDIPLEGRSNRWHLNYIGAPIFSKCLGQQLSILANEQNTDFVHVNLDSSK
jgi:hypothetical protein